MYYGDVAREEEMLECQRNLQMWSLFGGLFAKMSGHIVKSALSHIITPVGQIGCRNVYDRMVDQVGSNCRLSISGIALSHITRALPHTSPNYYRKIYDMPHNYEGN